MQRDSNAGEKFQQLVEIMARLRAPGGCPWDREQTFDTIKPFTRWKRPMKCLTPSTAAIGKISPKS